MRRWQRIVLGGVAAVAVLALGGGHFHHVLAIDQNLAFIGLDQA